MDKRHDQEKSHTTSYEWSAAMAQAIAAERRRLRALVEAQRLSVDNFRTGLIERIEQLLGEVQSSTEPAKRPADASPTKPVADHPAAVPSPAESSQPKPAADADKLDWEAQKRKLMLSLESDAELPMGDAKVLHDDEAEDDELLTIEGAISITDEVIAEKDREIAQLKQRLNEQLAMQDPAVERDEVVARHRRRIEQMEKELQQTLRDAEMQASRERAELARQRNELEQLRRDLEDQRANFEKDKDIVVDTSNAPKKTTSGRGRWLARLGLKEHGDDQPAG